MPACIRSEGRRVSVGPPNEEMQLTKPDGFSCRRAPRSCSLPPRHRVESGFAADLRCCADTRGMIVERREQRLRRTASLFVEYTNGCESLARISTCERLYRTSYGGQGAARRRASAG